MRIAVLGNGMVGQAIANKLVSLGHEVRIGTRCGDDPKAKAWVVSAGALASCGTLPDAAAFGEVVFNCTRGTGSLEALAAAGAANLEGKLLIDVANPLEFTSDGLPGVVASTESLGERIQRAFPKTHVVKALNTVNCKVMVEPKRVPGVHDMFISGNDTQAKERVTRMLKEWFGWESVVDLGDISTARGTEGYMPLWLRLWGALGTADFNLRVVRTGVVGGESHE